VIPSTTDLQRAAEAVLPKTKNQSQSDTINAKEQDLMRDAGTTPAEKWVGMA